MQCRLALSQSVCIANPYEDEVSRSHARVGLVHLQLLQPRSLPQQQTKLYNFIHFSTYFLLKSQELWINVTSFHGEVWF